MSVESVLNFKVDPPPLGTLLGLEKVPNEWSFPFNEDNKFKGYLVDAHFRLHFEARKSFPLI